MIKIARSLLKTALFFWAIFFHSTALSNLKSCETTPTSKLTYYVSNNGKDYKGDGSYNNPWRTVDFAIYKAEDNSTIIVKPGIYKEQVRIKKAFKTGLLIKAEIPYQTKFTFNSRIFAIVGAAKNITIEGFEFTHIDKHAKPVLVHIDGFGSYGTPQTVKNITLRNNIFHDSYNNDLLKINNGAQYISIECNIFYNQGDSDEHIDVNSIKDINISNNIFFNSFKDSNRRITNKSSSFIVVKDSNQNEDQFLGSENVQIDGNIFLNWQGSLGHGFILVGEDGKPYYEANNVNIYNNLIIGNSNQSMRSPLGIKGAKNVTFYNNTITGDLPSNAYALRINRERENPINDNIFLYNNIWNDSYKSMGMGSNQASIDFADVLPNQLGNFQLKNNLVYNGGHLIPYSLIDKINPSDDKLLKNFNPQLPHISNIVMPIWDRRKLKFKGNLYSINNIFMKFISLYATPGSQQLTYVENTITPNNDIIGNKREKPYTLGALQLTQKINALKSKPLLNVK